MRGREREGSYNYSLRVSEGSLKCIRDHLRDPSDTLFVEENLCLITCPLLKSTRHFLPSALCFKFLSTKRLVGGSGVVRERLPKAAPKDHVLLEYYEDRLDHPLTGLAKSYNNEIQKKLEGGIAHCTSWHTSSQEWMKWIGMQMNGNWNIIWCREYFGVHPK